MIREIARLTIDPARKAEFLAPVEQVVPCFKGAKGCRPLRPEQVIETPGMYRLHVFWDTLEAHTVDFRESPAFQDWRALAGRFFTQPPQVDLSQGVAAGFDV